MLVSLYVPQRSYDALVLQDKWKTLVHTATIAPHQRRENLFHWSCWIGLFVHILLNKMTVNETHTYVSKKSHDSISQPEAFTVDPYTIGEVDRNPETKTNFLSPRMKIWKRNMWLKKKCAR